MSELHLESLREVHGRKGAYAFLRKQLLRSYARVIEWTTLLPGRRLNLDRVESWLFVGGAVRPVDYPRLQALGITAVVDLRAERQDDAERLRALGIEYLNLPAPDHFAPRQAQLAEGARWMQERVEAGGSVYVHCQHGVGRAPLQALCLLVARGESPDAAYRKLRAARWQATLNDRQLAALAEFAGSSAAGTTVS